MSTPTELARQAGVDGPPLAHLQRLVRAWGLLSDLCFSDLLLFVPDGRPASAGGSGPDGAGFLVVGQIRPTTSQTLYRDDQLGRVVSASERPLVARAWALGEIIDGVVQTSPGGEIATEQCIPVRWDGAMVAVLSRDSAPSVGRRPGDLEHVYVEVFDRFARMITVGDYPFGAEESEVEEAPRVGDGVARVDESARVDFASPNFVSALHRMGVHRNTQGARLGELGFDESPVRAAFALGLPITQEIERGDVILVVRCIPFLDRGQVTGAVVLMRDVSDLRHRDRLLISKDATIREIHHRVKNNLQTISSLMRLQGRRVDSPEARAALEESERRVRSIALVHETLSTAVTQAVQFGEIVRPLVRMVEEGLISPDRPVRLVVEGDPGELRAEIATPLAVVLTELLQNAVRHGYPATASAGEMPAPGRVVVSFANDGVELVVRVVDDGVGLPPDFAIDGITLGLTIVRTLVTTDLGGTINMATGAGGGAGTGTTVELRIPV